MDAPTRPGVYEVRGMMPRAAPRRSWVVPVGEVLALIVFIAFVVVCRILGYRRSFWFLSFFVGTQVLFVLGTWLLYRKRRKRLIQKLIGANFHLCLRCATPINDQTVSIGCRKCGAKGDLESTTQKWKWWLSIATGTHPAFKETGAPRAVKSNSKEWALAITAFVCIYLIARYVLSKLGIYQEVKDLMAPVLIGGIFPLLSNRFISWNHNRLSQQARDNDFHLCLRCAYTLTNLPPQHTCPECGIPYNIDENRLAWTLWSKGQP